jgi:serine/threonine protein kinase
MVNAWDRMADEEERRIRRFKDILLEPVQKSLLIQLAEIVRSIPRNKLQKFIVIRADQGDIISCPNHKQIEAYFGDLEALDREGLIALTQDSGGFDVTPSGFAYRDYLKETGQIEKNSSELQNDRKNQKYKEPQDKTHEQEAKSSKENWEVIEPLNKGGQGQVYRVREKKEYLEIKESVTEALRNVVGGGSYIDPHRKEAYDTLCELLPKMLWIEHFALKVLHETKDARDPKLAKERIKREIIVMSKNLHPNLIELVDSNPDEGWFVSKFYAGGTLAKRIDTLKGNFLAVLKAIRPIVEGVASLHKEGYIHRDIKPENIFIGAKNELILGDFGLVYFDDPENTRISETYQNVGSRDWMPAWAMGKRIDEVKPAFDVSCLGKVLWAMTSGQPILRLWYFKEEEFNIEKMFPESRAIQFANQLFEKCIVEKEKDCLPDAGALLQEIDKAIGLIESGADRINLTVKRKCKVCGIGEYNLVADENQPGILHNFGFNLVNNAMKVFACTNCGNVQLFSYSREAPPPPAWRKPKSGTQT